MRCGRCKLSYSETAATQVADSWLPQGCFFANGNLFFNSAKSTIACDAQNVVDIECLCDV